MRILIVEDKLDIAEVLSGHLRVILGCDTSVAVGMAQAVEMCNAHEFDFILTDLDLNGDLDGIDLINWYTPRFSGKVGIYSALDRDSFHEKYKRLRFPVDFMASKPLAFRDIANNIKTICEAEGNQKMNCQQCKDHPEMIQELKEIRQENAAILASVTRINEFIVGTLDKPGIARIIEAHSARFAFTNRILWAIGVPAFTAIIGLVWSVLAR